jgi:MFS family permease
MSTARDRRLLAGVVFVVLLSQVLLYPGVDRLVAALGAETDLNASMWFLAAEFGAFVAFAGVWGAASDAAGRRRSFIAAGAIGGGAGYAALVVLPAVVDLSFRHVLVLRVAQGAATIGAFSLAMTMLMDLEGGQGRNMGAAGIAIGSGTALGAPLGGQLYEVGPFVPLVVAGVLLGGVGVLALGLRNRVPEDGHDFRQVLAGFRDRPMLGLPYAFGFVDRFTAGFFALVGTLYFRTAFGLSPGATGAMLMLFFAPFALLQYPFGVVSDRVGRTLPILGGSSLYGLGVVAVGHVDALVLVGTAMVLVGVLGAVMAPATMALVGDIAGESERGVAMAGFNAVGSVGFLSGILVGGTVAGQYGFPAAFLTAGGVELAIVLATVPLFFRLETGRTSAFTG